MANFISIEQASKLWGLSKARITKLCREGRIDGTVRKVRFCRISENAE